MFGLIKHDKISVVTWFTNKIKYCIHCIVDYTILV